MQPPSCLTVTMVTTRLNEEVGQRTFPSPNRSKPPPFKQFPSGLVSDVRHTCVRANDSKKEDTFKKVKLKTHTTQVIRSH